MQFNVIINDNAKLNGIAAARARYNADHPEAPLFSDGDYVQMVMDNAAASYATQFSDPKEATITNLTASVAQLTKENQDLRATKKVEA